MKRRKQKIINTTGRPKHAPTKAKKEVSKYDAVRKTIDKAKAGITGQPILDMDEKGALALLADQEFEYASSSSLSSLEAVTRNPAKISKPEKSYMLASTKTINPFKGNGRRKHLSMTEKLVRSRVYNPEGFDSDPMALIAAHAKILRPTPVFIFKEEKYDNELRSPMLESYLDYKRPLPEPEDSQRSVSPSSSSDDSEGFRTMDQIQSNIEYNYICEYQDDMKLIHFKNNFNELQNKLGSQALSYMYEGGDGKESKWSKFKKDAINDQHKLFVNQMPAKEGDELPESYDGDRFTHAHKPNDAKMELEARKLKKELTEVIEQGKEYNQCPCCLYTYSQKVQKGAENDLAAIMGVAKSSKLEMIEKYQKISRDTVTFESGTYKVPQDFQIRWLRERGLTYFPGDPKYDPEPSEITLVQMSNLKNEMRVAYLAQKLDHLQEMYKKDLKQAYNKNEAKMKQYAIGCVRDAYQMMVEDWRTIFLQLENLKDHEHQLKTENTEQRYRIIELERSLSEVKLWGMNDQAQHQLYIDEISQHINDYDMDKLFLDTPKGRELLAKDAWLAKVINMSQIDKLAVDLSEPFTLFGHSIKLGLTERLNVLERETVQIFRNKLREKQEELIELKKKLYGEQYQEGDSDEPTDEQAEDGPKEDEMFVNPLESMITQIQAEKQKIWDDLQARIQEIEKLKEDQIAVINVMKDEFNAKETDYHGQIARLDTTIVNLKQTLADEKAIRDKRIADLEADLGKSNDRIHYLNVKLKIPRMHLKHLEKQGKLEEFVQAQLLGQTAEAKWLLQKAAEKELDVIEETNRQEDIKNAKELRRLKMLKMFGQLKRAESADKAKRAEPTLLGRKKGEPIEASHYLSPRDHHPSVKLQVFPMDLPQDLSLNATFGRVSIQSSRPATMPEVIQDVQRFRESSDQAMSSRSSRAMPSFRLQYATAGRKYLRKRNTMKLMQQSRHSRRQINANRSPDLTIIRRGEIQVLSMKDKEGLGKIFEDSLLEDDADPTDIDAKNASMNLVPDMKIHGQTVGLPKELHSSLIEEHSQLQELLNAKEQQIQQILASRHSVQTQKPKLVHKLPVAAQDPQEAERQKSLDSVESEEDMLLSSKMYRKSPTRDIARKEAKSRLMKSKSPQRHQKSPSLAKPIATSEYLSNGKMSPKSKGFAINQDLSDIYRDTFLQRPSASAMDKVAPADLDGPIQEKDLKKFELIDHSPLVSNEQSQADLDKNGLIKENAEKLSGVLEFEAEKVINISKKPSVETGGDDIVQIPQPKPASPFGHSAMLNSEHRSSDDEAAAARLFLELAKQPGRHRNISLKNYDFPDIDDGPYKRQRISAIEEFRTVFSPKRMHRPGRSEGMGTARTGNISPRVNETKSPRGGKDTERSVALEGKSIKAQYAKLQYMRNFGLPQSRDGAFKGGSKKLAEPKSKRKPANQHMLVIQSEDFMSRPSSISGEHQPLPMLGRRKILQPAGISNRTLRGSQASLLHGVEQVSGAGTAGRKAPNSSFDQRVETFKTNKANHSVETGRMQASKSGSRFVSSNKNSNLHVIEAKVPRIQEIVNESQKVLRINTDRDDMGHSTARKKDEARNPLANARLTETSAQETHGQLSPMQDETELHKAMARSFAGNTLSALLTESRKHLQRDGGKPDPLVFMRKSTDQGSRGSMIQSQILRLKAAAKRKDSRKLVN